jgi:hypothetical protein
MPHVIGRPVDGLSVVSVNGSRHAVVLVSDLDNKELTQLAGFVSLPLVQQLGDASTNRPTPTASIFAQPVQELASYSERRLDLRSLLTERLLSVSPR